VVTQKAIIGIKIDRIQDFVGMVVERTHKMRVIAEGSNIFGGDPKLEFNFGQTSHHYAFPLENWTSSESR
jgi:hypothetical protein